MAHGLDEIGSVSDAELVRRLEHLVNADRSVGVKLIVHLGELEERRLFLGRGYGSLYDYCRNALRMSDDETYLRIQAARAGKRFPLVLERLGSGAVHLSGIKLLAPLLTAENHVRLLDWARGKSKRQIGVLVAELDPKPDAPARLRKLPSRRVPVESSVLASLDSAAAAQPSAPLPLGAAEQVSTFTAHAFQTPAAAAAFASLAGRSGASASDGAREDAPGATLFALQSGATPSSEAPATELILQPVAAAAGGAFALQSADAPAVAAAPMAFVLQSPERRASTEPLSPGRFKLEVTLGQDAHDQLEQLRELLRHQNPSGDLARIVERALSELLEREMKRRFAQTSNPKRRVARKARSGTNVDALQPHAPCELAPSETDTLALEGRTGRRPVRSEAHAKVSVPPSALQAARSGACAKASMSSADRESARFRTDAKLRPHAGHEPAGCRTDATAFVPCTDDEPSCSGTDAGAPAQPKQRTNPLFNNLSGKIEHKTHLWGYRL